jgi:hypothetical protein
MLAILLAAFALRVTMCFFSDLPQLTSDSLIYMRMAGEIMDGTPSSFFPNGFPLVIAGIAIVFGDDKVVPALMLMNTVMSTCVVAVLYLTAKPILEYKYAMLATLLSRPLRSPIECWVNCERSDQVCQD